jgi:endonuclease
LCEETVAQLYDKPVTALMNEMVDALAPTLDHRFTRQEAIQWFATHYPKVKLGTVAAHLIKKCTNDPTRYHYHARPGIDDQLFRTEPGRYRRYNPETDPAPVGHARGGTPAPVVAPGGSSPEEDESDDGEEPATEGGREFAYERDLRSYLVKNLGLIEPGLRLYDDGEGITGEEFPVGGRRIDILAVDQGRNYVVVELKVRRAYDRVVGQLLRYMAWIEENHAEPGESVRGVIIANEISTDLRLACSRVPGVKIFKYSLSVSLEPIAIRLRENPNP